MSTSLPASYESRSGVIFTISDLAPSRYQVLIPGTGPGSPPFVEVLLGTEPDVSDFLSVIQMLDLADIPDTNLTRIQEYLLRLLKALNYRPEQ